MSNTKENNKKLEFNLPKEPSISFFGYTADVYMVPDVDNVAALVVNIEGKDPAITFIDNWKGAMDTKFTEDEGFIKFAVTELGLNESLLNNGLYQTLKNK